MEATYVLRHLLAVLRYRCAKAINNSQEPFSKFEVGYGVRTPLEILYHINSVLRYAQSILDSNIELHREMRSWNEEVEQFYIEVDILDVCISDGIPDRDRIVEKLLQGPLSDVLTHVGQLSMMRRISGDPIQGENFLEADITIK
jgi:hypothetical protein